ncbi:unnamed protein product [Gordionus sp. m RMFG-2023]
MLIFKHIFFKPLLIKYRQYNNMIVKSAVILGCYTNGDKIKLTPNALKIDQQLNGKLSNLLSITGPIKLKKSKTFYGLSEQLPCISVVGIGVESASYNSQEMIDDAKENVRLGIGCGCCHLKDLEIASITVDPCNQAEGNALVQF